jgi:hypothetical protein
LLIEQSTLIAVLPKINGGFTMFTINRNNTDFSELVNTVPEGLHLFYNRRYDRFEYHYDNGVVNRDLSKAPCVYYMKSQIWEEFYSLLSEEEYDIACSYPYRRGYFNHLKGTGLFEVYELARQNVINKAVTDWLQANNISLMD